MTEEHKKTETTPMDIKVLGSGCPTCKKLFNLVSRVAKEVGITESIIYVPDIKEVLKLKVLKTPIITIRGKAVMIGFDLEPEEVKKEKIKKILLDNQ
ncbi:MAG: thioredoxin family protein [Candidatus Parcubacteria bacterium]|nr:thioredoxin family protein [Candidatus Parcubacteria bacterium]